MKRRKYPFFLIVLLAAVLAYLAAFGLIIPVGTSDITIPGAPNMRFGIDIRGGVDAAYRPVGLDRKPTAEELESARAIIETRMDSKNILDRDVTIDQQNGYILVRFPWKADETEFNPQKAIAELGATARLTFRDSAGNILVEGKNVKLASPGSDQGKFLVHLSFDAEGATLFDQATAKMVGQPIDIYMDETLIQRATVETRISGGEAVITNMQSAAEAKALSDKINAGALPFSMESSNLSSISPTLGAGAMNVMLLAGTIALALIMAFMVVYYRLPGFVACIALVIQAAGQVLAVSILQITLTLPGITGIILSIGMSVDANVIIAERVSEEIKGGKALDAAIAGGYKTSFSAVFDSNITVLLAAGVLWRFGSGAMLSFAYSLVAGIVLNFLAGVTCYRIMTRSLSRFAPLRKTWLFTCLSRRIALDD